MGSGFDKWFMATVWFLSFGESVAFGWKVIDKTHELLMPEFCFLVDIAGMVAMTWIVLKGLGLMKE